MTYNTPELLLIGAAQNLVLGGPSFKTAEFQSCDDDTVTYPDSGPLDDSSW